MGFNPATRTLGSNEIFAALSNMIISQQVFANNIGKHQTLVDSARVEGGLFGDTKVYYSTDALWTTAWGNDAEATDLLKLHRPKNPQQQAIAIDVFRQVSLTVDNYLSKRPWQNEGAFSEFQSVMTGWMTETKKIYDGTTYNVFVGTTKTAVGNQTPTAWALTAGKEGQEIAQKLADLLVDMEDYNRDYNDYGNMRSFSYDEIKVIWNSKYVNLIKKYDMPTLFHKDGLVDKLDEYALNARYFGTLIPENVAKANVGAKQYRSAIEANYVTATTSGSTVYHVMPGDYIPASSMKLTAGNVKVSGTDYVLDGAGTASTTDSILANEAYTEDANVICKICVELPPYMSAFEVETNFFNAKSLTDTKFLTFGHNTLAYLKQYPFVTVKKA